MLPGLMPVHTRRSFHSASGPESSGSRLMIEHIVETPGDFIPADETGLWLLPTSVAEKDLEKDIERARYLAGQLLDSGDAESEMRRYLRIERLLGRTSVDETGCLYGGLRGKQSPAAMAILLSEFEMRSVTHTPVEDVPLTSVCGNDACYNARHHNLDFSGVGRNMQQVELNPSWYTVLESGEIETIWGDILPPVEASLKYFIDFQLQNFPFVSYADSLLTATPVSQIAFHPLTGCWEAYLYEKNTPGLANLKGGYGVMYSRQGIDRLDQETGEITSGYRRGTVLAHILIWEASGREITPGMERNHLCNYTRCCNPLHIEEITPEENRAHGVAARSRIRQLEVSKPETKDDHLSLEERQRLFVPVRSDYQRIFNDLASSQTLILKT